MEVAFPQAMKNSSPWKKSLINVFRKKMYFYDYVCHNRKLM